MLLQCLVLVAGVVASSKIDTAAQLKQSCVVVTGCSGWVGGHVADQVGVVGAHTLIHRALSILLLNLFPCLHAVQRRSIRTWRAVLPTPLCWRLFVR